MFTNKKNTDEQPEKEFVFSESEREAINAELLKRFGKSITDVLRCINKPKLPMTSSGEIDYNRIGWLIRSNERGKMAAAAFASVIDNNTSQDDFDFSR